MMINLKYTTLQNFLSEKILDMSIKKKATSIALGIALSRIIPIPSSAVDSSESHYAMNVQATAAHMAADFNENIVVDIDLVTETIRSYWMIRYANAHPDMNMPLLSLGNFGFLNKLVGAGRFLNMDTNAFTEKYSELMIVIVNRITIVLAQKETE